MLEQLTVTTVYIVACVAILLVWGFNLIIGDWLKTCAKRTWCWLRTGHGYFDIGTIRRGCFRIRCKDCGFTWVLRRRF